MRKASCQTIFVLNLQNHSFNKEITRNEAFDEPHDSTDDQNDSRSSPGGVYMD